MRAVIVTADQPRPLDQRRRSNYQTQFDLRPDSIRRLTPLIRIAVVVSCVIILGFSAHGSEMRSRVERNSDLERELAYKLSVQDKHGDWRSQGFDKLFPVDGAAREYVAKFHATAAGKLKDLFGLTLTIAGGDGIVVQRPLAIRSKWSKEDEIDVQFLIKKELISDAVLKI